MRALLLSALLVLNGAAFALDAPAFPKGGEAGCASPVGPGDTAKSLRQRFGDDAKIDRIAGAEGERIRAVVLFGKDKARRIEVIFFDDRLTRIYGYILPGEGGKWTAAGLAPGASVDSVERANGGPFDISGFDWDYGGYVVDYRGGALEKLPGGCRLSLRFEPTGATPAELGGDGVKIASTDKRLLAARPRVSSIAVNFPARR